MAAAIVPEFAVESLHRGRLFDGCESRFVVRSREDLAAAKACVSTREPIYASGRMAVEGYRDRSDPLLDGDLKDGVDFSTRSIVIVGGEQCNVSAVAVRGEELVVTCESDETQRHGREYSAAVVVPALPSGLSMRVVGLASGGGRQVAHHARAVVHGPRAAPTGRLEQRAVDAPPPGMLEQRAVDAPPPGMLEQRAVDATLPEE
ncbi:hypothetical protein FNF29_00512 [Cafeteria roenbergensis]|uniref:Uncharacterized protein n=1 Tax=Cafeteria roenbergensis TaxID=33653 RepID=A0A5A8CY88_CAFRO|nr:hypothetical protein FNF29_00512 [Cafeteria roenbergensis]|eukprot:KAA0157160.1 hypothetical protein FNF29_00512 [Cafeteria roenbergensis]